MSDSIDQKTGLTRREVLLGTGAVLASAGIPNAFAADGHHHGHQGKHSKLIESALHCMRDGEACLDHCMQFFKKGDTSMAACAESVTELVAMCTALQKMASYDSKHLGKLASVCMKVCKDCEKECNKHAKKHEVCAACARSCKDCIKACKKIAA
ncbi:MAG: four-helix bundle copper-binding protein [Gammaproteobacteria bacterium]|nr:four-helix bundle copper-binding protein [Gammaproteobacteria bacterium]